LALNCTGVVQSQASAEVHLLGPVCDRKSSLKALSPLTKGLIKLANDYGKLSARFTKWAETISLLFWFAGTTLTGKLHSE
jgi:hypothetical protein